MEIFSGTENFLINSIASNVCWRKGGIRKPHTLQRFWKVQCMTDTDRRRDWGRRKSALWELELDLWYPVMGKAICFLSVHSLTLSMWQISPFHWHLIYYGTFSCWTSAFSYGPYMFLFFLSLQILFGSSVQSLLDFLRTDHLADILDHCFYPLN